MIVLDFIVAQQENAFPIRDELPFKMSMDVLRTPAEDFDSSVLSGIIIAHHDVKREIRFYLCPFQSLFDSFGAPFRSEIARNDLALGIENRYLVGSLSFSPLPPFLRHSLVRYKFFVHVPYPRKLNLVLFRNCAHVTCESRLPSAYRGM